MQVGWGEKYHKINFIKNIYINEIYILTYILPVMKLKNQNQLLSLGNLESDDRLIKILTKIYVTYVYTLNVISYVFPNNIIAKSSHT